MRKKTTNREPWMCTICPSSALCSDIDGHLKMERRMKAIEKYPMGFFVTSEPVQCSICFSSIQIYSYIMQKGSEVRFCGPICLRKCVEKDYFGFRIKKRSKRIPTDILIAFSLCALCILGLILRFKNII